MENGKSIFDLERSINLKEAYNIVIADLKNTVVNPHAYRGELLFSCLNEGIKTWPYRNAANSIDMYTYSHGFSLYGGKNQDMIYSFELIANLLKWISSSESNFISQRRAVFGTGLDLIAECCRCYENIAYFVEKLNMSIREKNVENSFPKYVINKRDVDVDAVLETVPALSEVLLTYLDIRNQNSIEAKRLILKQIADFLEPKRRQYNNTCYSSLCDDLFYVFNNFSIRHNNDDKINLSNKVLMELYDRTFKAAIHLLQKEDVNEFHHYIKYLKG